MVHHHFVDKERFYISHYRKSYKNRDCIHSHRHQIGIDITEIRSKHAV